MIGKVVLIEVARAPFREKLKAFLANMGFGLTQQCQWICGHNFFVTTHHKQIVKLTIPLTKIPSDMEDAWHTYKTNGIGTTDADQLSTCFQNKRGANNLNEFCKWL